MSVYSMNDFKLSKEICEEINGLLARFWWKSSDDRKGMHLLPWNRIGLPKKGGIGLTDLESFNLALLDKQVW